MLGFFKLFLAEFLQLFLLGFSSFSLLIIARAIPGMGK